MSNQNSPNRAVARCSDCPPIGYPTDKTRCIECTRVVNVSYAKRLKARKLNPNARQYNKSEYGTRARVQRGNASSKLVQFNGGSTNDRH